MTRASATSTTTSRPRSRATSSTASPRNESPNNTGRRQLPDMVNPDVWYSYRPRRTRTAPTSCSRSCSRSAGATASARWAARRTTSGAATARRRSGRARSTAIRCSTSGRATTSRCSSSTAERRPARADPQPVPGRRAAASSRTTRWTWSSVLTAPCTRSSTATGSSRDPGGAARPHRLRARRRADAGPEDHHGAGRANVNVSSLNPPFTVKFSGAGTTDANGDSLAYAWDFNADGWSTPAAERVVHLHHAGHLGRHADA